MNKDIAQKALETALACGASGCRVTLSESTQTSVSYLNGEIEKLQESTSATLGIALFTEGRYGAFSTNRLDGSELRPFIRRCIDSCRLLAPDDCRTLPDPSLYYRGGRPDLEQCDPHFSDISFKAKTDILEATDAEVDKSDSRLISTACDWDDCLRSDYIIDTQGLEAESSSTFYSVVCECTVRGHGEARPQNNWMEGALFFDRLRSGCGRTAYERTVPGKYRLCEGRLGHHLRPQRFLAPAAELLPAGLARQAALSGEPADYGQSSHPRTHRFRLLRQRGRGHLRTGHHPRRSGADLLPEHIFCQ